MNMEQAIMRPSPTLSVLIPCYNYGRYLRQAVESALAQHDYVVNVLIIDDASNDSTSEIASHLQNEYASVQYIRHRSNIGHIRTFNEGIDWAVSDLFLLLSADDYLLPGALSRAAQVFSKHEDVALSFGDCLIADIESRMIKTSNQWHPVRCTVHNGFHFIERSRHRNLVPTPTAIVRTEVQKRVGYYKESLPHCGDMEMWWRFAACGNVGQIHAHQAVKRNHGANMTNYYALRWVSDLEQRAAAIDTFFDYHLNDITGSDQLKLRAKQSLSRMALHCARSALVQGKLEDFDRIMEFTQRTYPQITDNAAWRRLVWFRTMRGPVWPICGRAVATLRRGTPGWLARVVSARRFRAFE